MSTLDTDVLHSLIDQAVHPNGPLGKTTAPGLSALLHRMTTDLAAAISSDNSIAVEQDLSSGSTTSAPSVRATAAAVNAVAVPTELHLNAADQAIQLDLSTGEQLSLALSYFDSYFRDFLPFTTDDDLTEAQNALLSKSDTLRSALAKLQKQFADVAPADTITSKLLVVQGYGQLTPGVRGRFDRPFASPAEAVAAAQPGDTVLLLPGGDTVDASGRPVYSGQVDITKSLNFVFLGAVCSGYWIFGPYPGALYDMRVSVRGGHWTGGIAIIASNGFNHRYYFDDCRFEGESAVFELVPDGFAQALNPPGLDVHEYRNCVWDMTYQTESGCFVLQNRTDSGVTQHRHIILDNCRLATAHTPVFVKWWNPGDRIVLRGTTVLLPGPGQPLQTLSSPNDKPSYPDADVFTDERPSAATPAATASGASLAANYGTLQFTAPVDGAQSFSLPAAVSYARLFDVAVIEQPTQLVRSVAPIHYALDDNQKTVSFPAEANLKQADTVVFSYVTAAVAGLGDVNLEFAFNAGFADSFTVTATRKQAATYGTQALSNVASAAYAVNGAAVGLPFTLAVGDMLQLSITRLDSALGATVSLTT